MLTIKIPVREIDGARFDDLDGFFEEISRELVPGSEWGKNLDAFNDILRGGFGTPPRPWVLRWLGAGRSRERLGQEETLRWLQGKLARCNPEDAEAVRAVRADIAAMEGGDGETLFVKLVEIVRGHGPEGQQQGDGVLLELIE
jgi:RNAse (barnase) inhibitor barstar